MTLQGAPPAAGPRSYTWARHDVASLYCAILEVADGSVKTLCRGRWPTSDTYEIHDKPAEHERCGGCMRIAIDPVERGLAELAAHQELG